MLLFILPTKLAARSADSDTHLFEAENRDNSTGDHDNGGDDEDRVEHFVARGDGRHDPAADAEPLVPLVLVLAELAAGRPLGAPT